MESDVRTSDLELFEKAQEYKSEGNDLYKEKNYRQAIKKYHRALLHLRGIGQMKSSGLTSFAPEESIQQLGFSKELPPETQREAISLQADCYNNLAACLIQVDTPNYQKIIEYCDRVLEISPGSAKALYRKGMSLYNLQKYEKALEALEQAKCTDKGGNDPAIKKYMHMCKQELDRQERELKKAYKSMFSHGTAEELAKTAA
ncbi:hypothetical protein ACJMK2_035834 [Sinanodonta woodiana]|uniref:Tetratricopeptide repeat protein 9C n=1 Tax=Sinanodonta woodiana TaxID=1069815 RepID=A0ABD3WFB8_SINWO